MKQYVRQQGFSPLVVVLVLVIIGAVGFSGWYVWNNKENAPENQPNNTTQQPTNNPTPQPTTNSDPSEGGKYLVIKEWGVRTALPSDMQDKITYQLTEVSPDPDGNNLQAAKILILVNSLIRNECASTESSLGEAVDTGAQYIRSEATKSFDAARYKWTFKENILVNNSYAYHLNYITPDCIGEANEANIHTLQATLNNLVSY